MRAVKIVDYGSQYTYLIARRLRTELGVWTEIIQPSELNYVHIKNTSGVIFSGGPQSVCSEGFREGERRVVLDPDIPVLGICYGMQLIASILGGKVEKAKFGEFGLTTITHAYSRTTRNVWMSHNDVVTVCGEGSSTSWTSPAGIAAFENLTYNCSAVQYHPEVTQTERGLDILRQFVMDRCRLELNQYTNVSRFVTSSEIIRNIVRPHDFVVLGLSGGVDSMVTATLLAKTLERDQFICVYVDFGTMRQDETVEVVQCCEKVGVPFLVLNRKEECLAALKGVRDPEEKRKIMGKLFIDAFKSVVREKNPTVLAQGTIYPDIIESSKAGNGADMIKSHHNVGGLPKDLGLKLLEPLKWFFKDEVRMLGRDMGLPEYLIGRHPFPGPGLTIRVLGEVTEERLETARRADAIFIRHIRDAGLYDKISQAYAGLLDSKAVGVVGDQRRYAEIIVLRAVCTDDFMTATAYEFDAGFISRVASEIVNNIEGVARVTYDYTSKPPGTIELE